ncbi:membrane protein insertase YidC [Sulfurospirillum sp. T05]|uniref:Membrane protein insertase YidC n=1 Tax=Sulfurospirillum tamanense TaxID=2813362 RepID=A0ABS2WRT4_9BACT|nr:membrane protein insertase YidC [Sulfurospirillum tamanensis]
MIDKLSTQHRVLIATVLSFAFFVGYDYFFIPKNVPTQTEATTSVTQTSAPQTPAPSSSVSQTAPSPSMSSASLDSEYIATVRGEHFELKIDRLGRIAKYYLNDAKFKNEDTSRLQLIDESFEPKPLEVRFKETSVNNEAFAVDYTVDNAQLVVESGPKTLVLTQVLEATTLTKKLTFYPEGHYEVAIELSAPQEFFITPGFRPNVIADNFTFHGVLIKEADETITVIGDGDAKGDERFIDAPMVAAVDRYYTTLLYDFNEGFDVVVSTDKDKNPILFIKGKPTMSFSGYVGPKDYEILNGIDARLTDAIEYGWFTFIAKPLFLFLSYLYGLFGNWGWAIVAMTILIRLVLYPLTYKGMVSMNKLKELAPKVKELQAKYKGEPQKLNTHMMELYKKHGANPMGGCLPILMQIPIFFAIYRVLSNAIELKGAPWILWVEDLAVMDPYFVLPILMGATMFLHQRITPTNFTDPMQEKIMKFLPLIFTFFFVTFPAGLTLYWFVNNLFSIAQQYYVNHLFAKKKEEQKALKEEKK